MRLLSTSPDGSFGLISRVGKNIPRYAILSHTWNSDDQEVTYQDIEHGTAESKDGYEKLQFCRRCAQTDDIHYYWIDSCCIDRSNVNELTEAINSMFRWYRNADKCYVYLSDVHIAEPDSHSLRGARWFKRGWTLQELIAPRKVEFYSANGEFVGDKNSLELLICQETGLPAELLKQPDPLSRFTPEERIAWGQHRETTIEEDEAYCLFGILEIYMPLIYGEGKHNAFRRLRSEISANHTRDTPRPIFQSPAQRKEACLGSLAAADQTDFIQRVLDRSEGSCAWIEKNRKFVHWAQSKKAELLWLAAKPGCGKTTISAHICQRVTTETPSNLQTYWNDTTKNVMLSFFFHKSNEEHNSSVADVAFRTIIHQLACQVSECFQLLLSRYTSLSGKSDVQWSADNLSKVLSGMLSVCPSNQRVWIILDALDECEMQYRDRILGCLEMSMKRCNANRNGQNNIKILATSRPDGEMIALLGHWPMLDVTAIETADDLRSFVSLRVKTFAQQRHLRDDTRDRIEVFLRDNAQGMFLWVELIMKELEKRNERLTDGVIEARLSSIPLSLKGIYDAILESVPEERQEDTWRILRWMAFAKRTLTLAELEGALCLNTGVRGWYNFGGDLNYLCGSLIRSGGPREDVTFVHQTARAYIETYAPGSATSTTSEMPQTFHEAMAVTCMRQLLDNLAMRELLQVERKKHKTWTGELGEFFSRHPFARYAIESWAFHLRTIGKPSHDLARMAFDLLSMQARRDKIMELTYFIDKGSWNTPVDQSPLHLAAYFDLPHLARFYIGIDDSYVHRTTGVNDTPLIWASEMGSTDVVKLLLDAGADPNRFEIDGWSALHWAARNGHVEVAKLLLRSNASKDQQDRNGHTPLDWATEREHLEIVSLLEE